VLELFAGSRTSSASQRKGGPGHGSILDFNQMQEMFASGESPGEWLPQGLRSKADVLRSLAFCSAGLTTSFLIWGILQERMLTMPYRDGEYFTYSYGLVFTNRLFSLILSSVLVWVFERESFTLSTVSRTAEQPSTRHKAQGRERPSQAKPCMCPESRLSPTLALPHPLSGTPVRVQLPIRLQHALLLVPVRGPLLRHLPHPGQSVTHTHGRRVALTHVLLTPSLTPLPPQTPTTTIDD
jgi:hypothetical protein